MDVVKSLWMYIYTKLRCFQPTEMSLARRIQKDQTSSNELKTITKNEDGQVRAKKIYTNSKKKSKNVRNVIKIDVWVSDLHQLQYK